MPTKTSKTPAPLRVLITGASTGIGYATALRLGSKGHHVALVARRKELLEDLARKIEEAGGKAFPIAADLADASAPPKVIEEAVQKLGGLDVLINNAGFAHNRPIAKQKTERVLQMLDVNLRAPMLLCKEAIPHLRKSRKARIINVASVVGHAPFPGMAVYSATKHALVAFSDALRAELAPKIKVSTVSPGLVDTPMAEVFAARGQKGIAPEAVAKAIEKLIAHPRANIFIPRYVEGIALARRFAPRSFRRGIEVYGRLRGR